MTFSEAKTATDARILEEGMTGSVDGRDLVDQLASARAQGSPVVWTKIAGFSEFALTVDEAAAIVAEYEATIARRGW